MVCYEVIETIRKFPNLDCNFPNNDEEVYKELFRFNERRINSEIVGFIPSYMDILSLSTIPKKRSQLVKSNHINPSIKEGM